MITYPTGTWETDAKIPGNFVRDFNLYSEEILNAENSVRGTLVQRLLVVWLAAKEASLLPGDFVECGVASGQSAWFMSRHCNTNIHLFDSWQGVTDFTEFDNDFYKENEFHSTIEFAQNVMKDVPNVFTHVGEVPFEFDQVSAISMLHIDLNNYNPTKIALESLWDKVVNGGIVVVDFHDSISTGAEKATRDFFDELGKELTMFPTGKAVVIK